MAGHKNEKDDGTYANEDGDEQDHDGALIHERSDIWFADP